jgi:histone H3/H4
MPRRKATGAKSKADEHEARICNAMAIERKYLINQQMVKAGARKQLYKGQRKGIDKQLTQLHYMSNKGFSQLVRAIAEDLMRENKSGDKPAQWNANALKILREHIGSVAVETLRNARNAANFANRSTVMPKDLIFLPMMCSHDVNRYELPCGSAGPEGVGKYTTAYINSMKTYGTKGSKTINPRTGALFV